LKLKKYRTFVGDFETTVYENQEITEVWASALVEMYTEDVAIYHSLPETYDYLISLKENIIIYYHNLKFDGSFWLSFIATETTLKQAFDTTTKEFLSDKEMPNNSYKYTISDKGQWYSIKMKVHNCMIEIRDSLKLLPFSVKRIGKAFKTKHQKLEMEYEGFRYAGCVITPEEREYIANDVLVVKEALEMMFSEGHNSLTIGSCCLKEFKSIYGKQDYQELFPDLSAMELDKNIYGSSDVDEYIRHSYKGGWCYVVKGKENKRYYKGTTADVNSLYPSMMSSESGNKYPVCKPYFWSGNYIPDKALMDNRYFFIRIKTRFYIKENMLPFIQIKGSNLYRGTEYLESSDVFNYKDGQYYTHYIDLDGNVHDTRAILTLTCVDYYMLLEHYELVDFEILDGCWFYTQIGIFDDYIEKYKKIKVTSTGAKRELAKLFLNNLYGKMATSRDSSFKTIYVKDDEALGFMPVSAQDKKTEYIAVGSAITSYARHFTITSAQANYHGVNERGFIYADTDSIHCDLLPEELKEVKTHDTAFCCWKLESCWDVGIFARQKTYIEHVTHENLEAIEKPFYNIKCAGMPQRCKDLLNISITGDIPEDTSKFNGEELEFISKKRELEDFKYGLKVPSKLMPKRIKGGVILVNTSYEMR